MFADRKFRVVSYHDTWMSLDPVRGCPYSCGYCVLRDAGTVGIRPEVVVAPEECVRQLLTHPLFVCGSTPIAVGNETDMFAGRNTDYLVRLLATLADHRVTNPLVLITKAPLDDARVSLVRRIEGLRVVFFLSYSGLGPRFEPNFTDAQLRRNFEVVAHSGLPIVHYWRPLLPENTTPSAVREMLAFVSPLATSSVLVGLKIHPNLTPHLVEEGGINVPPEFRDRSGEWLVPEAVTLIHEEAARLCPEYPLYRHSACALARVFQTPTVTGTVFREDICPPSRCPGAQRVICGKARVIAEEDRIASALAVLGRPISYERCPDRVVFHGAVSQEQFSFLLHQLRCPIQVERVEVQNLYHGSILAGQILGTANELHPEGRRDRSSLPLE